MQFALNQNDVFGPEDIVYAKAVARKIFDSYDRNQNSLIENQEVDPMMRDVYKNINVQYNPTEPDIAGYSRVLDRNRDGQVTLPDIETLCVKYLIGERGLQLLEESRKNEALKKSAVISYLDASVINSPPPLRIENYKKSAAPYYADRYSVVSDRAGYNGEVTKRSAAPSVAVMDLKNYVSPHTDRYNEAMRRSVATTYDTSRFYTPETERYKEGLKKAVSPVNESRNSVSWANLRNSATPAGYVERLTKSGVYLQKGSIGQIKRVFDKYDVDKNGFIDEVELKTLIEETYKYLGVNKVITSNHVQSYMNFVDANKDGKISYPEYETIVVRALARHNIRFE